MPVERRRPRPGPAPRAARRRAARSPCRPRARPSPGRCGWPGRAGTRSSTPRRCRRPGRSSRVCTVWPLMSMPRIWPAPARPPRRRSASLTPPALPRPPVFTCALTTTLPPPSGQPLGGGPGLLGGLGDGAAEHGHAVLLEQVSRLVLEQVHGSVLASLWWSGAAVSARPGGHTRYASVTAASSARCTGRTQEAPVRRSATVVVAAAALLAGVGGARRAGIRRRARPITKTPVQLDRHVGPTGDDVLPGRRRPLRARRRHGRHARTRGADHQRLRRLQGRPGRSRAGVRPRGLRHAVLLRARLPEQRLQDHPGRPRLRRQGRQAAGRLPRRPQGGQLRPASSTWSATNAAGRPEGRHDRRLVRRPGAVRRRLAGPAHRRARSRSSPGTTCLLAGPEQHQPRHAGGASPTAPRACTRRQWTSLFFGIGITDGIQGAGIDPTRAARLPQLRRPGLPGQGAAGDLRLPRPGDAGLRPARLGVVVPRAR